MKNKFKVEISTKGYLIYRIVDNIERKLCKVNKLYNAELIKDILNTDLEGEYYTSQNDQMKELNKIEGIGE